MNPACVWGSFNPVWNPHGQFCWDHRGMSGGGGESNVWPSFPAHLPHGSLTRILIGSVLMRDLFWDAGRDKHWLVHEARPTRTSDADWTRGFKFTGPGGGGTPCDPIQGAKSKLSMTDLDHITAMTIKNLHIDSCVYIYIYISVSGFHSTRTRFRGDAGDSREKAVGEMGRDSGIYSIWYLSIYGLATSHTWVETPPPKITLN